MNRSGSFDSGRTNCDRLGNLRHSSVNPLAFTEQGVAMLATVLRLEKAIQVNIEIITINRSGLRPSF